MIRNKSSLTLFFSGFLLVDAALLQWRMSEVTSHIHQESERSRRGTEAWEQKQGGRTFRHRRFKCTCDLYLQHTVNSGAFSQKTCSQNMIVPGRICIIALQGGTGTDSKANTLDTLIKPSVCNRESPSARPECNCKSFSNPCSPSPTHFTITYHYNRKADGCADASVISWKLSVSSARQVLDLRLNKITFIEFVIYIYVNNKGSEGNKGKDFWHCPISLRPS